MSEQYRAHDHDDNICQHRTYKGGQGVDNASGVREWACSKPEGHDGPCEYTRDLGTPVARW